MKGLGGPFALLGALTFLGPCVAPQPACEVMSVFRTCKDGSTPRCKTKGSIWRENLQWSAYCGFDNGAKQPVTFFIFIPYVALGGVFLTIGATLARRG